MEGVIATIFTAIIGAIVSAFNSARSHSTAEKNYQQQQEVFEYNKEQNEKVFQEDLKRYEEQKIREDTALQRQVADAKAAGLNIATVAGGNGAPVGVSTPSQFNMLEAPQKQTPQIDINNMLGALQVMSQVEKTRAETKSIRENTRGKIMENDILADTKEWQIFEKEQTAKNAWRTGVGQELSNRLASLMTNRNLTKADLENDILELEKAIRENDKSLSDAQEKQRQTLGILPTDSPEIQAARLRKIYKYLKDTEGSDADFIRAYAKEYNDRNNRSLLQKLASIMGGKTGAVINDLSAGIGAYDDDGSWDYSMW